MTRAIAVTLVVLILATLGVVFAEAAEISHIVRILAENVLGAGSVTALSVTEGGSRVQIRWESGTYRAEHSLDKTRELLYAEAELVVGSVMGRLANVTQVRFAIVRNGQVLAGGWRIRGGGIELVFSALLGGGTHVPPARPAAPASGGGTGGVKGD